MKFMCAEFEDERRSGGKSKIHPEQAYSSRVRVFFSFLKEEARVVCHAGQEVGVSGCP